MESIYEHVARLRSELARVQEELFEAEAELADRRAEVHALESALEERLGTLLDRLAVLTAEIDRYKEQMERMRHRSSIGGDFVSAQRQYQRTWQKPPESAAKPPAEPPGPATEAEIKRLYRRLARHFHPDLGTDNVDRAFRTEKMAAVNSAYAARSLSELMALADEMRVQPTDRGRRAAGQTDSQMVDALREELRRCRRRLREIKQEMQNLDLRPSVQLWLEIKLARRQRRDLLAEMVADLKKRIARSEVERDLLKSQFDEIDFPPFIGPVRS